MPISPRALFTSKSFNAIYLVVGIAILVVAFPLRDVSFYVYVISISVIATIGSYSLLISSRNKSTAIVIAYLVTIVANLTGIYVCLSYWSSNNSIILLGAWLLVSTYLFHLSAGTPVSVARRSWLWINAVFICAIVLATPEINGVSFHLQEVSKATHLRIYLDKAHPGGATEHSRAYVRPSERGRVGLHIPSSSIQIDELNLLMKSPEPTTSVTINEISYDNYLGYRRFTLHDIQSGELADAFRVPNSIDIFRIRKIRTGVTIDPITEPLWLILELPDKLNLNRLSSAYIVHVIRALLLWELVWFSFLFLAPLQSKRG